VQGELNTREYDRTIAVRSGKKTIEHSVRQLVVELRADTIRLLDPPSNGHQNQSTDVALAEEVPE
jgi:single-strand DNA-binding protein